MTNDQLNDLDYPYAPRAPLSVPPAVHRRPWRFPWNLLRIVLRRLALAVAVAIPFAAVAVGIVAYRARCQASVVKGLVEHGFHVTYWYEMDDQEDRVPGFLRNWCGDDFWGNVGYIGGHAKNADDSAFFCDAFGKLKQLRGFGITSDVLTLEQVSGWPHFSRLEDLAIWSPHITDENLARIAKISTLRTLSLRSLRITDLGIQYLASLPRLEELELFSVGEGEGLRDGRGFPHLQKLEIHDSPDFLDDAILNLGPLPELREVVVKGARIGDRAIEHFSKGRKLSSIEIELADVTDDGLASLERCEELNSVELIGASITNKGLVALAGKQLWQLTLDRAPITDDGLDFIKDIQGLMFLSLKDTRVTGTFARHLPELSISGSLHSLDLDGAALTHDGIAAIAGANLPDFLESKVHLSVARANFNDADLMLFVENDKFRYLDITETKVTSEGVRAFCEARKRRLTTASLEETLTLASDYPEITAQFDPPSADN